MPKKVAIIGAGAAGLASIKNALDVGLEPTAFEKSSWLGGIWYYTEDDDRFVASKSTILNTSKHFSCFSDFPMSKEMPNYLTREDFQRYFELYAEKFDLTSRVRFNCEVLKVDKCDDYKDTGRWEVHSVKRSNDDGQDDVCVEVYDYVMVCNGVFAEPFMPQIRGLAEFTGRMIHSISYKTFTPFEGRRVLVIGIGNTAGDIACELSRHAKQVYISTRRGVYITPRMGPGGIPVDISFLTRFVQSIPKSVIKWLTVKNLQAKFNLRDLGLEPNLTGPKGVFPIINDELPHRIVTGTVLVKDVVTGFKDKKVFFQDGTTLDDIDDVICATGFNLDMSFLSKSVFDSEKAQSGNVLYKNVFPPHLPHPTLAFIGMFRILGAIPPILEMQGRWAVQVFKGALKLPSKEIMDREITERRTTSIPHNKESASTFSYILTEGFVGYLDDIACLLGVKPNFWKLFFQDPAFAIKCFFGPCVPAQYRLTGPGRWSGARQVIEEVEESRLTPLATRKVEIHNPESTSKSWIVFVSLAVVIIAIIVFYK